MTDALLRGLGLLLVFALAFFLLSLRAVADSEAAARPAHWGTLERDGVHGTFWRPAGSAAVRPARALEPESWSPAPER
jgi:hypothetical protein